MTQGRIAHSMLVSLTVCLGIAMSGCGGNAPASDSDGGCPLTCPSGEVCSAGVCVVPKCASAQDCDDHFNCTLDECTPDGHCTHTVGPNSGPTSSLTA